MDGPRAEEGRSGRQGLPAGAEMHARAIAHETERTTLVPTEGAEVAEASSIRGFALRDAYQQRVRAFNRLRARAAREALRRLRPQPDDYLRMERGAHHYAAALERFRADRYVRELQSVIDHAARATVPVFEDGQACRCDPTRIPLPHLRRVFTAIGLPLAPNAPVEDIAGGCLIVATMPTGLLVEILNPLAYLALRPDVVETRVEVEEDIDPILLVDAGLQPSLRLPLRSEARLGLPLARWPEQRYYRWARRLAQLPIDERRLLALSPLLCAVANGRPVVVSARVPRLRFGFDGLISGGQARELEGGDLRSLPDPLDPLRMPPGASLIFSGRSLAADGLEWAYEALASEPLDLEATWFGLHRLSGSQVAVFAGDEASVEHVCLFGVDITQAIHPELRVVVLDLGSDTGRLAYRYFLGCGHVPRPSTAAPAPMATSDAMALRDAARTVSRRLH